jgi:lambda family phage minor tail protein L
MTSIVSELQLLSPSAIIELFELQTTLELHGSEEIYRFHSGVNMRQANGDIIWNGNAYSKFPIEADGFEFNGKQMPRPTLRVANLFSSITAVLLNVKRGYTRQRFNWCNCNPHPYLRSLPRCS